jgi:thiamine-phosphate pyrophosphorylase
MKKASRFGPWPRTTAHGLPALWLFTDPRAPVDLDVLPRGAGVVLRHYNHPQRAAFVRALVEQGKARGLIMLVAGDMRLALAVRAHGVHVPKHQVRRHRKPYAAFIITAAAHSRAAVHQARFADGVFLSPVFPTRSHVGAPALGRMGAAHCLHHQKQSIFALGGIVPDTAKGLATLGFSGVAAIDGWS